MAVFTYTKTDAYLGKLSNGLKIVQSVVTIADSGTDATTIFPGSSVIGSASPDGALKKIIAFHVAWRNATANLIPVSFTIGTGTSLGGIVVDVDSDMTGAIFEILAVGV